MPFPIIWQGKPLFRYGKLAMSLACCCDDAGPCWKACFYVHNAFTTYPDSPTVSPPLTSSYGTATGEIVYHARVTDDATSGYQYHTHIWIIEYCVTPISGKTKEELIQDYEHILYTWAATDLTVDWTNGDLENSDPAGDIVGVLSACTDAEINAKVDAILIAPVPYTREVFTSLQPRDSCPECGFLVGSE